MKYSPLFLLCLSTIITVNAQLPLSEESSSIASQQILEEETLSLKEGIALPEEKKVDNVNDVSIAEEATSPSPLLENEENGSAKLHLLSGHPMLEEEVKEEESFPLEGDSSVLLNLESSSSELKQTFDIKVDLKRAFAGSPLIYMALLGMSLFSVFLWLYSLLSLKKSAVVSSQLRDVLEGHLNSNHFEEALTLCNSQDALLCKMVASGIQSRKYGLSVISESMKAQGKRTSMAFWQKIGVLNDIAVLAPMLGLLGTVLGMFYAFYDVNRSIESISTLFDGLGISVGTTVAGLLVAILALILHSTAKYRLIKVLAHVEGEAHQVASLIDSHASFYTNPS